MFASPDVELAHSGDEEYIESRRLRRDVLWVANQLNGVQRRHSYQNPEEGPALPTGNRPRNKQERQHEPGTNIEVPKKSCARQPVVHHPAKRCVGNAIAEL